MALLHGVLDIIGVSATDLDDMRFITTMSPVLLMEYHQQKYSTLEHKGGGKSPKWKHTFPSLTLHGVLPSTPISFTVTDADKIVGTVSVMLYELLQKREEQNDILGSDRLVQLLLRSVKDTKKVTGELQLGVNWTTYPANSFASQPGSVSSSAYAQPHKQAPMLSQASGLGASASILVPVAQPVNQKQTSASAQPASAAIPQQQQQQSHPIQAQSNIQYAQPAQLAPQHYQPPTAYAPQPHIQPMSAMMAPTYYPPGTAIMHQPPPAYSPPGYAAGPAYTQPGSVVYAQPGAQPIYMGQQPAPMAASAAVAPWQPQSNSNDGVFPFSELKITRLIGDGTFGTVSAGEFRSTPVAIKQLKQSVFTQQQWSEFMSEVKFLREARHPNIVLFMGVSYNPYCIVTELLDTSLFDVLYKAKTVLTHKQKVHIALGIARGLASLHGHAVPIVHRDMKSLNILVSNDLVSVKICDLGMVKFKAASGQRLEQNGTPLWMAPEVLLDQPYDEQADVYSFGCVLYELTTSTVPFGGGNIAKSELVDRVGLKGQRPQLPNSLEKHWKDILIGCWQQHPQARPQMKKVVEMIAAIKV